MYSIGQLAKMSNSTVRTLRYYDEIGLLKPAKLSDGNHRYYDSKAIEKLHNIVLLKELGFELETIRSILKENIKSSKELLQLRLELIEEEQARLEQKKKKVNTILQVIDMEGKDDWETIFNTASTIKKYNRKEIAERWDSHFTEKEQNVLRDLPVLGENNPLVMEWIQLLKETKEHIHVDPASEKGQQLAKEWVNMIHVFYKGDRQLANKVWDIGFKKKENIEFYQFEPEMIDFIERLQIHYYKNAENLNEKTNDE